MGGDYTRVTFDPVKGFSGLHKQQGRVSLDWEFNEFEEILDRRDRAEMFDATGQTFVPPLKPNGFKIGVGGAGQLTIDVGRLYVDGILAECFGDMSAPAATVFDVNLNGVFGPAPIDYDKQPFFYQPAFPALSATPGTIDLVYLDVWQREVTVFEEPKLREIALNGPDTATRVQTAWQVKVLQNVPANSCATPPPAWTALTAPSTGRITAATTPVAPAPGPCVINPAGGYTGLENRLYRVEIHKAGTVDGVTKAQFKWSRDNASLAARVLSIVPAGVGQSRITVSSTGRDAWMRFEHGDHIELLDDHVEWAMRETGVGGSMATIVNVNHATGEIQIDKDLSAFAIAAARHPRIRRWDIASAAEALVRDVNNGTPIPLEEGISVTFGPNAAATLHAGDYIVFAARTADGTIDTVDSAPPRGILHHFAKLALVTAGAPPTVLTDCRLPPATTTPPPTTHESCCTVVVKPGDDVQAAIDSLPPQGGCVCLKVGDHNITAPLVIAKSRVTMHGESIGARVLSATRKKLLIIGDFATGGVEEVTVHDLHFETAGGGDDTANPDRDAIIAIVGGSDRIAVYDCGLVTTGSMTMAGIVIFDSALVRIERNLIAGMFVGVRTIDDCSLVTVRDNLIVGPEREGFDLGIIGVFMERVYGACEAIGNHIQGHGMGIRLNHISETGGGSKIVGNTIDRTQFNDDDTPLWGIEIEGKSGLVRDNRVVNVATQHGGIHARATQVRIEDNEVFTRALETVEATAGIVIEGESRPGEEPFEGDGVISTNRLRGRLGAIGVGNCRGVEVIANDIRLDGFRGTAGVVVRGSRDTLVSSNFVHRADFGIGSRETLRESNGLRITGNQISEGNVGVYAEETVATLVADNVIDTMTLWGVILVAPSQTSTVSRNRLSRCCISREEMQAAILVSPFFDDNDPVLDEIVVEFNDVLDTGVINSVLVAEADGIRLGRTTRSRVQGNHVYYSNPENLPRGVECRALRIDGARARTRLGRFENDWTLVLSNSFVGVGRSALVEISTERQQPLDHVTFSSNYCEHYNGASDRGATVTVTAELIVAQGNQVKGEPNFASFDFNNRGVLTFLGNISYHVVQPPPVVKPPIATLPTFNHFL